MCTLTWTRGGPGQLEVWFNRDENKARPIADPPSLYELDGVKFLSPRDPQGGGTWMIANEFGLVVCLLNKWELDVHTTLGRRKSRGQLVWNMATARGVDELESFLNELDHYPAFTLAGISGENERFWEWNGQELREVKGAMPMTSSSYCFEAVREAREEVFSDGKRGSDFHGSLEEDASAYTVRMNRPDAQTWSRSYLRLGKVLTWEYLAEKVNLEGEPECSLVTLSQR
ncbi:NRDE family protein [Akkermansiaceae bacterium]|nr:NRDE family protein [Akkermansiaceae bacterium]